MKARMGRNPAGGSMRSTTDGMDASHLCCGPANLTVQRFAKTVWPSNYSPRFAMSITIYGLDVAKRVFHLHWVEPSTGEIRSRKMGKPELIDFLSKRETGIVALEACGSAHWWRRKLMAIGHQVVLLHPKHVRAFVHGNKTNAADAHAIWTAVQQPGMRSVAGKTEEQQTMLALHRVRTALVKFRTAQVNQLRGLLYEFGLTFKSGHLAGLSEIRERMADIEEEIPDLLLELVREQLQRIDRVEADIKGAEKRIQQWLRRELTCKAIAAIPGIGPLTATALVATMGDATAFKSGREFAAFIGLVPRQSGTGGKIRLLGISKRGDSYLRTLLIHGARAVLARGREKAEWAEELRQRRPANVAAVALANKMARTAWAVIAHQRPYQNDYVSHRPA